jgi:uncharacterized protein YceH (UPF0502 family)
VEILLNEVEARVLGSLIEKEITTPDYYPMSLNSLVNACNQKSNRDPLMNLDEDAVRDAVRGLQGLDLSSSRVDSRVPKYEHRIQEVFNFTRGETAIVCALLLRGPQTIGELRGHSERLYRFEDLSDVQSVLQRLMTREPPLVKILPRQAGTKESRYMHMLCGDLEPQLAQKPSGSELADPAVAAGRALNSDRIERLEEEMQRLRAEFEALREQFESLLR